MKKLIILRGAPGCGKSTFIKTNNLGMFTISSDDIRFQFAYSRGYKVTNEIPQQFNRDVFGLIERLLELRMRYGLYTVIDATHSTASEINKYKPLTEKYGYKAVVVNFDSLPIEECKARNAAREAVRVVPDYVIDRMYNNFKSSPIPSWVDVITPEEFKLDDDLSDIDDTSVLVHALRNNPCIREKAFGNISSFNFTRKAFEDGIWDNQTVVARGLYINTATNEIVARGFNKFFNIGERKETQLDALAIMKFPVTAYVKENGYLGLVSYNAETDDLLITSKSELNGDFAKWLRDALYAQYSAETIDKIREICKTKNVTFVFENVDMKNDPHIIDYDRSDLYLIAIIRNTIEFKQYSYNKLVKIATELGIKYKTKAYTINTYKEFVEWYKKVMADNYKFNDKRIEGFVIEDSNGYMVKVKCAYYSFWKSMRYVVQQTLTKGVYAHEEKLTTDIAKNFYEFCKELYATTTAEERAAMPRDIIFFRKKYAEWSANK